MTNDPARAAMPTDTSGVPLYGRVGPADPNADPITQPSMIPAAIAPEGRTAPVAAAWTNQETQNLAVPAPEAPARSRSGMVWTGAILSALVLVLLLIFILQNTAPMQISFLMFAATLPTGVALLFAAVAGLLIVAIPGGLRILQLRRALRRSTQR